MSEPPKLTNLIVAILKVQNGLRKDLDKQIVSITRLKAAVILLTIYAVGDIISSFI